MELLSPFFFRKARFDILTYITKTQEKRGSLYQRVVGQKLPQQSKNKQQKNKEVPTAQEGQNNQLFWGGQRKKKSPRKVTNSQKKWKWEADNNIKLGSQPLLFHPLPSLFPILKRKQKQQLFLDTFIEHYNIAKLRGSGPPIVHKVASPNRPGLAQGLWAHLMWASLHPYVMLPCLVLE